MLFQLEKIYICSFFKLIQNHFKSYIMQNKGLIKLFAFLFVAVSIYQLSFTYIANKVEEMQQRTQTLIEEII